MKRKLLVGAALVFVLAGLAVLAAALTGSRGARVVYPALHPTVSDYQFVSAATPTEADCEAVARTCFTPQAIQSAYNVGPLYQQGYNGRGMTIAIVDSYGSDTMAHDLHVFDQAFGLQPMCGEEGVTCTPGMPKFSELALTGSPATKEQPGKGTHLEDKSAWALEVALDVETSHAIAPQANILLVHSNNAETLGVQGFPHDDAGRGLRGGEPPRQRHLAELRLGRGCVRELPVAAESALRVQKRGRERCHRARRVRRRRHCERNEAADRQGWGPDPVSHRGMAGLRSARHRRWWHVPVHEPDRIVE